jgi:hypothetical protein
MTAVEWFNQQLVDRQNGNGDSRSRDEIFEQAKEMEKEQMEITWNNAIDAQLKDKWDSYDDFHKTTFKSE